MYVPYIVAKHSNLLTLQQAAAILMMKGQRLTFQSIGNRVKSGEADYTINEKGKLLILDNGKVQKMKKKGKTFVYSKQEKLIKLLNNENDAFNRSDGIE